MPSRALGLTSCTAWASTCAVECRNTSRPSSLSTPTGSTTSPSCSSWARSRRTSLTLATTMERSPSKRSAAVVPVVTTRGSLPAGGGATIETSDTGGSSVDVTARRSRAYPRCYRALPHRFRPLFAGRVPPADEGGAERPQLPARHAAGDRRVLGHDPPRRLLVGRLDDGHSGVHPAERGTREDEHALVEQPLEPLRVLPPDLLLRVGHGSGEVVAGRVDEVDPLRHHGPRPRSRCAPVARRRHTRPGNGSAGGRRGERPCPL